MCTRSYYIRTQSLSIYFSSFVCCLFPLTTCDRCFIFTAKRSCIKLCDIYSLVNDPLQLLFYKETLEYIELKQRSGYDHVSSVVI